MHFHDNKSNGFTLIEVLIALMIIAIALSAVIRAMNQSIRVIDKVKTAMATHWVAMNALSEIQLGMIRMPAVDDPVHGKAQMFGQTWEWMAKPDDGNLPSYATPIRVIVTEHGQPIDSISGFVS